MSLTRQALQLVSITKPLGSSTAGSCDASCGQGFQIGNPAAREGLPNRDLSKETPQCTFGDKLEPRPAESATGSEKNYQDHVLHIEDAKLKAAHESKLYSFHFRDMGSQEPLPPRAEETSGPNVKLAHIVFGHI